ncbi:MAG: hypothetical protein L6R40_005353 [Gallowayella cf. fulva]|nr:MAG: hypothetical protein L6R40_005353 [Xanthomendoza cf. fulva]
MLYLLTIALAIWFTTASAQSINISEVPTCAQACLINSASEQTTCQGADVGCLCKSNDFINVVACCISSSCSNTEQAKAISANVKLCSGANVTIPNYLGCSPSLASKFSASAATVTQVNNAVIQSAVMIPTNGPVAVFTGRPLFTGTCTTPQFAMVTMNGGGVLEYPWAGCSYDRPGCCPFDVNIGGSLSVCPSDYTTTSNACCPSGWSIHTSSIGNNIPCVSTLSTPLAAPSATGLRKRAPVSVIVTSQLYTLKYALKPKKSGLSVGAKAGIAIGVFAAALFGALLVAFIIHKRQLRSRGLSEGTIIGDGSFYGPTNKRSGTFSHAGSQPGQPSELPSPTVVPGGGFWLPPGAPEPHSAPPPPPIPMQELPASTHIHEHHPMFQSFGHAPEQPPVPTIRLGDELPSSAGLVSPMEEPQRR